MDKPIMWTVIVTTLVAPAYGQIEFKDDFTAVAVYDSASLLGGCTEFGGGPLTKYTIIQPVDDDIFNMHAVSGAGRLAVSDRIQTSLLPDNAARYNITIVGAVNLVGCTMPGSPDYAFSDPDICIYGGAIFDPFDLVFPVTGYGPDGGAGVLGVDDDCDGTTDDPDESPIHRAIAGTGYGPPFPDGGSASCGNAPSDGLPGVGGVDDDGDGTTDEYGELGLGNDSDDNGGRQFWSQVMKLDLESNSLIWLNLDPGSSTNNFALRHMVDMAESQLEAGNELGPNYYQADIHYNYAFCASGTCFGAVLWTEADIANPNETLGPKENSNHTSAQAVFVAYLNNADTQQYQRSKKWLGNSNFDDAYWVCEGTLYPSPSADLDDDKDVDGFDFLTFSNCYNSSNKPPLLACANLQADLDKDGDVDGFDFLSFSNCYNGSNRKPLAACFPPNLTNCGS